MPALFLLFTLLPLLDLWILTRVGARLGFLAALALVVIPALLGAWLAKREGLRVWRDWRQALAQRRMPAEGVVSGLLVLVGCVLLVTPGLLSDAVGLALLVPPVRRAVATGLTAWLGRRFLVRRYPPARRRVIDV